MAIELLSSEQTLELSIIKNEMLQSALLQAETVSQLATLIVHSTHWEIMQAFEQLPAFEQQRIQKLWEANISEYWK